MLNKKIKHREKIIKRQNKLKGLHQRTRLYQLFYNHLEKYAFVLGIFLALLYIFLIKFVVNKQNLSLIIIIMNTMIFIAFGFWTKSLVDYTKIDHFTNLYNRNFFSLKTKDYLDQIDANKPLTMLVMDIDQFKKINDDFGHLAGDQALLLFAEILNDNFDKSKTKSLTYLPLAFIFASLVLSVIFLTTNIPLFFLILFAVYLRSA